MTTELANLPGVWLVQYAPITHFQNGDDYDFPVNLGAFPTLELAHERIDQLIKHAALDASYELWLPSAQELRPRYVNLRAGGLTLEWVPFFRTSDPKEAAVIQDRANELQILDGRRLRLAAEALENEADIAAYVSAVHALMDEHYYRFVRGTMGDQLAFHYQPRLRPQPGETLTYWRGRIYESVFQGGIAAAFGLHSPHLRKHPLVWLLDDAEQLHSLGYHHLCVEGCNVTNADLKKVNERDSKGS